jgi:hypothetical protein
MQQYFIHIVAVSYIGGGETGVPREATDLPQVADKLLSHKVVARTPCHELDLNLQLRITTKGTFERNTIG